MNVNQTPVFMVTALIWSMDTAAHAKMGTLDKIVKVIVSSYNESLIVVTFSISFSKELSNRSQIEFTVSFLSCLQM